MVVPTSPYAGVTRNSHVEDIVEFLARAGAPSTVTVHHVGKGESKARAMKRVLLGADGVGGGSGGGGVSHGQTVRTDGEGRVDAISIAAASPASKTETRDWTSSAIFVDDSIAELLDAEVAGVPNLTRVLFSRVLA